MTSPLRPELYRRLERRFGKVVVASAGEEMIATVGTSPYSNRLTLCVGHPGEYYLVACPFCRDRRQRLWINHRWGLYVPQLRSNNLWLAHCFNEHCLAKSGRARQLYNYIFDDFRRGRMPDPILPGERLEVLHKAEPPGQVYLLHQLPAEHPANIYVRSRGFDPSILGQGLGVGYCLEAHPKYAMARDRLVVPIFFRGDFVGWQARVIEDTLDRNIPKYWTMPGLKKKQILYNFDVASRNPFVVVCEGVTDVWSFGPEAVGMFGKKISGFQAKLFTSTWTNGTVVILLDSDAQDEALEVYDALGTGVRNKVLVTLAPGKDPGEYPTVELRQLVFDVARQQGVNLESHVSPCPA